MSICFVIQPFDHGRFDKRYEDTFAPAIKAAGLEPYRVDRDPSTVIPIEQIEEGIRRADICLADISTNNPNVWFELGFAIAANKPVVLICEHQPDHHFPFDVQHRAIITYKTESARDFENLKEQITKRLEAAMAKVEAIERVADSSPVADVEGLNQHEMVTLITIGENISGHDDAVPGWSIRQDMERFGYTRIAVTLALTTLHRKKLIHSYAEKNINGEPYTLYSLDESGMNWLLNNQEKFVLKREQNQTEVPDDDIPF